MTPLRIPLLLAVVAVPTAAWAHGGEWVLFALAPIWLAEFAMFLHIVLVRRPAGARSLWPVAFVAAASLPFVFAAVTAPYQQEVDSPRWYMQYFRAIQATLFCAAPAVWLAFALSWRKNRPDPEGGA